MILDFWGALVLTVFSELIVYCILLRKESSCTLIISAGVLVNILTLPIVWYVFPWVIPNYWLSLALSELFVLFLESVMLAGIFMLQFKRAVLVSLCANAASFLLGLFITYLIAPAVPIPSLGF